MMTRWGEGRVGVSQCGGGHVIDRLCVGPGDLQANGQLSPLTRRKSHPESDFRTEQRQIRLLCEIPDDELAGGMGPAVTSEEVPAETHGCAGRRPWSE